jgi:hypothetical protein
VASEDRRFRRILAGALAALTLVAIGIAIGSRIASPESTQRAANTTSVSSQDRARGTRATAALPARTRAGAVAAAALAITAFDGDVLLNTARLRAVVDNIASTASRTRLTDAFIQASAQTRAKLAADTVPRPVIVLRSIPVGYRIEQFSRHEAKVAIWYVGIVGSGATVEPQQSWQTQIVSLVWERRAWKVSMFESSSGPTPPLSPAGAAEPPGDLFAVIPRFEEFQRAEP